MCGCRRRHLAQMCVAVTLAMILSGMPTAMAKQDGDIGGEVYGQAPLVTGAQNEAGALDSPAKVADVTIVPVIPTVEDETSAETEEEQSSEIPVFIDGLLMLRGIKIENATYVSLRAFCEYLSVGEKPVITWDEKTSCATVKLKNPPVAVKQQPETVADIPVVPASSLETPVRLMSAGRGAAAPLNGEEASEPSEPDWGLEISAAVDEQYISVNGRYFYIPGGVQQYEGSVMVPIREMCKAFGVTPTWDAENWCINLDLSEMSPLQPAETYYEEEDLDWLSRIIYAESGNQLLEGKIGVGNVILNRVEDPTCPDTIYDVIFDTKHGVQFTPTITGTIFSEPCDESIIAAKICLEGYELVEGSLFFVNPELGITEWFAQTRQFIVSFGEHDFYA